LSNCCHEDPRWASARLSDFLVVDRIADDGTEDCKAHDPGAADRWLGGYDPD
jgi:hypothetical protein